MTTPAQDALLARMLEEVAHLPSANTFRLGVARRVRLYRFLSDLADRGAPLPGNDVLRQPFDPLEALKRANALFVNRRKSVKTFNRVRPELERFFVVLANGRWAPSPKYFSVTDANADAISAAAARDDSSGDG